MLDIFDIKPHEVSRDLRGYSVMFYGEPKSGKTTTASKFPKSLIIAFEKGYAALPGVKAAPVNSWSDFLKILRQLKDPKAKEIYETIIIDTADLAYDYCEQYICNINEVDAINKIPYGGGYSQVAKEFDSKLRSIVQQDFGLVLISHSTEKQFISETGQEYTKIIPTLPTKARLICGRMCDIIAYSRTVETDDGNKTMLFLRGTPRFEAGSRFKHTPEYIEFNYKNLVGAISTALDKQSEEDGQFFVEGKNNINSQNLSTLDYDSLMLEFQSITGDLMAKDSQKYSPRITEVVERHLGKGKKASQATRDQIELLDIIVYELKELQ
ncbi:MAG: ATP-binding protein [Caulobacteraceae bacterium]|jgi:hypothetical protein|nr:ATP-binding protein [Caulobacteraceae bacterium]